MFGYAGLVDAIVERIRGEIDFAPRVVGTGRPRAAHRARDAHHRRVRRHADAAGIGDHLRSQPSGRAMSASPAAPPARAIPGADRPDRSSRRAPRAARIEARGGRPARRALAGRARRRHLSPARALPGAAGDRRPGDRRSDAPRWSRSSTRRGEAAWVVLPAAVIVTAAAGTRRDATRDLDLGAACYAPYFALRAIARLVDGVTGMRMLREPLVDVVAGIGRRCSCWRRQFASRERARPKRRRGGDTGRDAPAGRHRSPTGAHPSRASGSWRCRASPSRPTRSGPPGTTRRSARCTGAQPAPEFALPDIDRQGP